MTVKTHELIVSEFSGSFERNSVDEGLKEIQRKYPKDVVMDMSDDENLKKARKIRTERNKIIASIKRKKTDLKNQVSEYADNLINEVNNAYNHIVLPFEEEDKKRKEEKNRLKEIYEKEVAESNRKIDGIKQFISNSIGKSSEYIAGVIESVDLINVNDFHRETVHHAISVIEEVKSKLVEVYNDALTREDTEKENAKLRRKLDSQTIDSKGQIDDNKNSNGYSLIKEFCMSSGISQDVSEQLILIIKENFIEKGE